MRAIDPRKRILIGAAWLYKASPQEAAAALPQPGITARDVYGFWAPLDIEFLSVLVRAARVGNIVAVVVAQPRYLFAYLDFFDPATFRATPLLLMELAQRQATRRWRAVGSRRPARHSARCKIHGLLASSPRLSPASFAPKGGCSRAQVSHLRLL